MIYDIRGKKVNVLMQDTPMKLPDNLRKAVLENFENMKKAGANIWNGAVLCVATVDIQDTEVNLICKMTDYAHYLYGENIGCPREYECRNLAAGCLIETIDGYYVFGELDDTTSYPGVLQTTGGGIDKKDISGGRINIEQTILREASEELNIDLNDRQNFLFNELSYLFVSDPDDQPGVHFFSKAKTKMTAKEFEEYFEAYNKYLRENKLEVEFKKLHFFRKGKCISELERLSNPKRAYVKALMQTDTREQEQEQEK